MSKAESFRVQVELVTASLALCAQGESALELYEQKRARVLALPAGALGLELDTKLGLSPTESAAVLVVAALAVDHQARKHASDGERSDIASDTLMSLVYGSSASLAGMQELSRSGRLQRLSILERASGDHAECSELSARLSLSPRVLRWLVGDTSIDPQLAAYARAPSVWRALDELCLETAVAVNTRAALQSMASLVVVSGPKGTGRRSLLVAAAREVSTDVLEIDATTLAKDHAAFTKQLKLLARECKLLGRAPLICNVDALVDDKDQTRVDLVGSELVAELDGLVFVTCGVNRPAMRWDRPAIVIDVKPPASEQCAKRWLAELGQGTQEDAEYLASQHPLAPALIHHAARAAAARANGRSITPDDIYAGIRAVLDDRLGDFAKRVEVTQTWDDLVLPEDHKEAIHYLVARVRRRRTVYEQWGFAAKVGKGLGTSALFSGPPGTGKTMVAALIAKELGLELYQVDMAKIASRWIGETERNLAALFDAAEAGHAILLFDEADSLFGKRTEVKSSNDRYANLETNYLLQRLESFAGICLLTSNHESNIDPAFQRRLSLHLRFELPDVDERAALWRAMLPAAAPVPRDLDMQSLARRFAMSGGYIRNAALRAAFLAADEGSEITGTHLERAAKLEYEGMGKLAA